MIHAFAFARARARAHVYASVVPRQRRVAARVREARLRARRQPRRARTTPTSRAISCCPSTARPSSESTRQRSRTFERSRRRRPDAPLATPRHQTRQTRASRLHLGAACCHSCSRRSAAVGLPYLFCYGGVEGPVDWAMDTDYPRLARSPPRRADVRRRSRSGAHAGAARRARRARGARDVLRARQQGRRASRARRADRARGSRARQPHVPPSATCRCRARAPSRSSSPRPTRRSSARPASCRRSHARPTAAARRATCARSQRAGKRVVLWDVNSFDWKGAPPTRSRERVLDRARPGSIILMHDAPRRRRGHRRRGAPARASAARARFRSGDRQPRARSLITSSSRCRPPNRSSWSWSWSSSCPSPSPWPSPSRPSRPNRCRPSQ